MMNDLPIPICAKKSSTTTYDERDCKERQSHTRSGASVAHVVRPRNSLHSKKEQGKLQTKQHASSLSLRATNRVWYEERHQQCRDHRRHKHNRCNEAHRLDHVLDLSARANKKASTARAARNTRMRLHQTQRINQSYSARRPRKVSTQSAGLQFSSAAATGRATRHDATTTITTTTAHAG